MALAPSLIINLPGYPFTQFPSLATVAALRAIPSSGLANGDNYVVDGAASEGDGGGGVFAWNDGSLAVDDGFFTVRPNDTTAGQAGRWILTGSSATSGIYSTVTASEAISPKDFINVYNSGGNVRVRRAIANDPAKFANGFAPSGISNGVAGLVAFVGMNGATVSANASEVWLSGTVPGGFTTTPPTASGSIIQPLGPAIVGAGIYFTLRERTLL